MAKPKPYVVELVLDVVPGLKEVASYKDVRMWLLHHLGQGECAQDILDRVDAIVSKVRVRSVNMD